jgi:hypothetical protein
MKRLPLVLAGLAIVMASCSSAAPANDIESDEVIEQAPLAATTTIAAAAKTPSTSRTETTLPESESRSSALAGTTTTTLEPTEASVPGPPPEGPPAPDFTLALGEDGSSTFTLSQETKPVFLIFWAEW